MNDQPNGPSVCDQFTSISEAAFKAGFFEAAYHGLWAALHVAYAIEDLERLHIIERIAKEQYEWINQNAPTNVMSAQAAQKRSGVDMFAILVRDATIHIQMVKTNRKMRHEPPE
jgi:hypothetical protein